MSNPVIEGEIREEKGSSVAKRLRRQGYLPAVLYGKEKKLNVKLPLKNLEKALKVFGEHSIYNLKINNEEHQVLIKEIQREPVKEFLQHVDFMEVTSTQTVRVEVEIVLEGEPKGVKEGGIVEYGARQIEIETSVDKIPPFLSCDVSDLEVGQSLTVKDLVVPEGVKILSPENTLLINVLVPKMSAEEKEEVAEEEQKEPLEE